MANSRNFDFPLDVLDLNPPSQLPAFRHVEEYTLASDDVFVVSPKVLSALGTARLVSPALRTD